MAQPERITAKRAASAAARAPREARGPQVGAGGVPACGRLEVIATPIGNLGDVTGRAQQALASADVIAAEDTRRTAQLLRALGIAAPRLLSLHEYNEAQRIDELLAQMRAGRVVALVSDAGTPLLSDPGFALVRACAAADLTICAIPGPSALTAALCISALPTARFAFEGFLPPRAAARRAALAALASETRTLIFFEAPHRIAATLEDMQTLFGAQRRAVIARELTKLHETVHRGTLEQLSRAARLDPNLARGELTLVVEGAQGAGGADTGLLGRALDALLTELPPGRAAAIAAQLAGVPRSEAYALAERMRKDRRS